VTLIGQGYRNKEIANKLYISEPTVKTHLQHIFQKLGVKNRSQLITFAIKNSYFSTRAHK
jgi:DNA-binding NarL/FixJ family response regulator